MKKMTPIEALQAICDAHKFNTASLLPHQVHEIAQSAIDAYRSEAEPVGHGYIAKGSGKLTLVENQELHHLPHIFELFRSSPAERVRTPDIDKRILAAFRAVGTWAGPNLTLAIERELGATVFADNGDDIEARMSYDAEHACPTCGGSGHKYDVTVVGGTIDILASYLDDGGHHGEASNVRNGTDLESYEVEFRLIDWILRHCKASPPASEGKQ